MGERAGGKADVVRTGAEVCGKRSELGEKVESLVSIFSLPSTPM